MQNSESTAILYDKRKMLLLQSTASALTNNLNVHNESPTRLHIAVVHRARVNIITIDGVEVKTREISCKNIGLKGVFIYQAKWVTIGGRTIMVIASQRGIQMFEWDGSLLLHWHAFTTHDAEKAETTYARGIAACGDNLLCIGTHDSSILVFHLPPEGSNITFSEKLRGHSRAISDLHGQGNTLASGDDGGSICVWTGESALKKTLTINGFGSPCTSLKLWQGLLLAAYGSGHLRLFDSKSGTLRAEVAAHARWITSVDIAPQSGLALSVSEDAFLKVWQIKTTSPVIAHKFSEKITDTQLCGGAFACTSGSVICTTGYDSKDVLWYTKSKSIFTD